jgi:prolyl-tRNA synthetase
MANKKQITPRSEDYSQWYLDIVEAADLAENSMVRGCMVIKPYGYALWEGIKEFLDKRFKETSHQNAYFPIFIPKSLLSREADHIKGFAKECAVVTHHRLIETPDGKGVMVDPDAKLEEELIVRPTSETIMYETYKDWITSWRDLPIMINQWNNVVRWELRTRAFLRTAEFLWQEGHTAHATHDEAENETLQMLGVYRELAEEILAVPVVPGRKSESEKFAGALRTYTIEAMMQDGKALQSGTSHNLGQNFSKAFGIKFADKDKSTQHVWQTSWGLSTRIIGALIMTHSDDKGLVLPPKIAPIQVVIVPIWKDETKDKVDVYSRKFAADLKELGIRIKYDDRDYETPGSKFNEWEKKGVPIRIEIGQKDMDANVVTVVRRDTAEKEQVAAENVVSYIQEQLVKIQQNLFKMAFDRSTLHTYEVDSYDQFKEIMARDVKGFAKVFWCEDEACEEKIKNDTKATSRCLPLDAKEESGNCFCCGKKATHRWIFAVAY